MFKRLSVPILLVGFLLTCSGNAQAVPILQLYVEGGTYDTATETWSLTPQGSSGGVPFRIWTIGQTLPQKNGDIEPIRNVRLSVTFLGLDLSDELPDFTISITPSRAGGLGVGEYQGVVDPSVPQLPELNLQVTTSLGTVMTDANGLVTNGSSPVLGNGQILPAHGIFGEGVAWQEYKLGDFTLTDSPIGDFIGSFPDALNKLGQVNVYEVSVTGLSGVSLHFDLYDTVAAENGVFAPFSHDADGETNIAPEPASLIVWMLLGLTWAGSAWRFQYRRRWQKWQQETPPSDACSSESGAAGHPARSQTGIGAIDQTTMGGTASRQDA